MTKFKITSLILGLVVSSYSFAGSSVENGDPIDYALACWLTDVEDGFVVELNISQREGISLGLNHCTPEGDNCHTQPLELAYAEVSPEYPFGTYTGASKEAGYIGTLRIDQLGSSQFKEFLGTYTEHVNSVSTIYSIACYDTLQPE